MKRRPTRRRTAAREVAVYAAEAGLYAALVTAYFFLALHFLGNWLKGLFDAHRTGYAFVALALIIGQGAVLELVTAALWRFVQRLRTRG